MRHLVKAELRGSWRAWLSVSLSFIATNFAFCLVLLVINSITQENTDLAIAMITGTNAVLVAGAGIAVLGNAAELVVASRRPAIARLTLAGASPGQVVCTLLGQLIAVSLTTAILGYLLALPCLQPLLAWLTGTRKGEQGVTSLAADYSPLALLGAALITSIVAVLGGYRIARRATRIPAVEALREASLDTPPKRTAALVKSILGLIVIALFTAGTLYAFGQNDYQKGDLIVQGALFLMILTAMTLSAAMPLVLRPLVRAWTGLIPSQGTWFLARQTVLARSTRLIKTVTPVMLAVGILLSTLVLGATIELLIKMKWGEDYEQSQGSGLDLILMLVGLAFLVSLSGALGNLFMMSRQRDADMALFGISGATQSQQRAVLVFEGLIIGVTGVLLGLIIMAVSVGYAYLGLALYSPVVGVAIPWGTMAGVAVVCAALCIAATVLPSLRALKQPPQRVVAKLIAE